MRPSARRATVAGALAALGSLGLLAPAAQAASAVRMTVEGLPVYSQATGGDRVLLVAHVRAGRSTAPRGRPEVADLLAAWMELGGTESLPGEDFAAARRALAAEIAVRADRDLLTLELEVPAANLHPAARLFADLVMYPALDGSREAAARRAVAAATALERPSGAAEELLAATRAWLVPGEPEVAVPAVSSVAVGPSRAEVAAFHRTRVGVDTTVLAVEGPIAGAELEREIRAAFLGFRRAADPASPPAAPASSGRGGSVVLREVAPGRSAVLVARAGLGRAHPDWLALAAGLLSAATEDPGMPLAGGPGEAPPGSRIRLDQPLLGPDLLTVEVRLPTAAAPAAERAISRAFASLGQGKVQASALERAKRYLEASLLPRPEAPRAGRAHALLEALGLPGDDPAVRHARLRALERGAVGRAASAHLR